LLSIYNPCSEKGESHTGWELISIQYSFLFHLPHSISFQLTLIVDHKNHTNTYTQCPYYIHTYISYKQKEKGWKVADYSARKNPRGTTLSLSINHAHSKSNLTVLLFQSLFKQWINNSYQTVSLEVYESKSLLDKSSCFFHRNRVSQFSFLPLIITHAYTQNIKGCRNEQEVQNCRESIHSYHWIK
jgi:hypothetical protein